MAYQTDSGHATDDALIAHVSGESIRLDQTFANHLASCNTCGERLRQIAEEQSRIHGLLQSIDSPLPHPIPAIFLHRSTPHWRRVAAVAAAGIAFAVAAAALAPTSPVARWMRAPASQDTLRPALPGQQDTSSRVPANAAEANAESGIAIQPSSSVVVEIRRTQAMGEVEIQRTDSGKVKFTSRGGTIGYRVEQARVIIDNSLPAVLYRIEIPRSVHQMSITMGGREILRWPTDSAHVVLPNEPTHARLNLGQIFGGEP